VRIRDTGLGISPEDQTRIFDEFFRSRQAKDTPGTGLGLAIVKRIIELHGGSVSVLSRQGEGSEFILLLPDLEGRA
jgi:signal transduction histidine kinase